MMTRRTLLKMLGLAPLVAVTSKDSNPSTVVESKAVPFPECDEQKFLISVVDTNGNPIKREQIIMDDKGMIRAIVGFSR